MIRRLVLFAAFFFAACGGPDSTEPDVPAVASVIVQPDSSSVARGTAVQLSATLRDANGNVLNGRTVMWTTSDATRATVTPNGGLVNTLGEGRVVITATSETRSGSAVLIVQPGIVDFSIVDAQFTQGMQAADGSIPMVLAGNAAVVNVLVQATPPGATSARIVLRLFDAGSSALVRADTAITSAALGANTSYATPSVQFLIPSTMLRRGLAWQVERDATGPARDDSAVNDVFPRTGHANLATVEVPTLKVRFVPIVLSAHSNTTGSVSAASIPEYLRTLQSIHPIGRIEAQVGTPLTTSASFGSPPSGGERGFWVQVLAELDLARLADPTDPQTHWYGVVVPPTGFNFTTFGGFAYIPATGSSTGATTRTAVGVQLGWFSRPTQARDLVAHELAHNFGRLHAPCGGAGAPLDGAYPFPGGLIDRHGHDVFSWATQRTTFATTVNTDVGDVMGYCFPVWTSTYTYKGILEFRGSTTAPPAIARVLVVRGSIVDGLDVELEPAFVMDARPSLPERRGGYRLEGLASDGRVLFAHDFEPAVLDHAPSIRPFTLAIPASPELEDDLYTLRVRGPAGEARRTRVPSAAPALPGAAPRNVSAIRIAGGFARVTCADNTMRGIVVQHAGTNALLGTTNGATILVAADAGTPLSVACSDGVRTERSNAIVR
jgi:hypothetical protein